MCVTPPLPGVSFQSHMHKNSVRRLVAREPGCAGITLTLTERVAVRGAVRRRLAGKQGRQQTKFTASSSPTQEFHCIFITMNNFQSTCYVPRDYTSSLDIEGSRCQDDG